MKKKIVIVLSVGAAIRRKVEYEISTDIRNCRLSGLLFLPKASNIE
jgi:hypothetical protein